MTDPEFADRTYIEPLLPGPVAKVIERERPDALLPTLGGQTALNLAKALHDDGTLRALRRRADRRRLRGDPPRRGPRGLPARRWRRPGCGCRGRRSSTSVAEAEAGARGRRRSPCRRSSGPAFTLGGHGGGVGNTETEFAQVVSEGLAASPINQVLVEESVLGWGEFELEVMRDRNDNVVIICSIENVDPMGVHTGDSVTIAPGADAHRRPLPGAPRPGDPRDPRRRGRDRRLEHPVRGQPGDRRDRGDRDEPARLALLGARLEGDRLPDREDRRASWRSATRWRRSPTTSPGRRRPPSSRRSTTSSPRCRASPSRSSPAPRAGSPPT